MLFDHERQQVPLLPGLLQLLKGRRGRTLVLGLFLAVLSIYLLFDYAAEHGEDTHSLSEHLDSWRHSKPDAAAAQDAPSVNGTSETEPQPSSTTSATPPLKTKAGPTFHLLIPATAADSNFCRTVLSTMLLEYPPPTVLGYAHSEESTLIEVVHDHLQRNREIKDEDLVLLVDGYRTWFQLPASVLVAQYQAALEEANERLARKYGVVGGKKKGEPRPLFRQSVLWAADEHCWPVVDGDAACTAVPESPFFWDQSPYANASEEASAYNPKFANSGAVIGPARELRAIFKALVQRSASPFGRLDLQHALQGLFSEQEQARELIRRYNLGYAGRMLEWWYGLNPTEKPLRKTNITVAPGRTYEFAMGLDHNSTLFQSMSPPHSFNGDIVFLRSADQPRDTYDSAYATVDPKTGARTHHSAINPARSDPVPLPDPLLLAAPASPYALPEHDALAAAVPANMATGLTITPDLDDLPPAAAAAAPPWSELPLAHNTRARSVPAALHFPSFAAFGATRFRAARGSGSGVGSGNDTLYPDGGDSGDALQLRDPRDQLWRDLWFHEHARALLRRYMRQSTVKAYEDERGGDGDGGTWWRSDARGGRGGVWTEEREWLAWGDVCVGFEEEVFGDGKGVWLGEVGNPAGEKAVGAEEGEAEAEAEAEAAAAGLEVVEEDFDGEAIPPAEMDRIGGGAFGKEQGPGYGKGDEGDGEGQMGPGVVDADGDLVPGGGEEAGKSEGDNDDGLLDFVGEVWDEIKGAEKDQVESMDDVLKQIDEEMTERA